MSARARVRPVRCRTDSTPASVLLVVLLILMLLGRL